MLFDISLSRLKLGSWRNKYKREFFALSCLQSSEIYLAPWGNQSKFLTNTKYPQKYRAAKSIKFTLLGVIIEFLKQEKGFDKRHTSR